MARIQISISDEYLDKLDGFCDVAGATRSGVIEVLIRDYFDDLIEKVGEFSGELGEEAEEEGEQHKYPESEILEFRRRQEKEMYGEEGEGEEEEDLEEEGEDEEGEDEEDDEDKDSERSIGKVSSNE